MIRITHQQTALDAGEFVRRYRDVERIAALCAQCPLHGLSWACPPYDVDAATFSEGFDTVLLMGSTVWFDDDDRAAVTCADESRVAAERAIDQVWLSLLPYLYELERQLPGSRCFTGRCRLCGKQGCTRTAGKPCRHPQLMRHSLEAVGFDVVAAARDLLGIELQWSAQGELPRCLTVVSALMVPRLDETSAHQLTD